MGEAFATEAIAERIRNGGVWEAESNIDLLALVSRVRWKCEFDRMLEVTFVPQADDLALAMSHLVQSSSASRLTAGAAGTSAPTRRWSRTGRDLPTRFFVARE